MWQKFEDFIQSLFSDSEIQQCGFYLFKRLIDSGGIRVVLWSLYQDFEMAAAQARHTDNHEHPRIVCVPRSLQCQYPPASRTRIEEMRLLKDDVEKNCAAANIHDCRDSRRCSTCNRRRGYRYTNDC